MGAHTIYIRNNVGQKYEGNCGLWVLNEIIRKIYTPYILFQGNQKDIMCKKYEGNSGLKDFFSYFQHNFL